MNKDWLQKHTEQHLNKFRLATVLNHVAHSSVYFHKVFNYNITLCAISQAELNFQNQRRFLLAIAILL